MPDKTSHLPILYHINRMANDAEFIEELVKLEDVNEISKVIRNFSTNDKNSLDIFYLIISSSLPYSNLKM